MKTLEKKKPSERMDETEASPPGILEKIVLAEIEGKKKAIQVYDEIIWKVRTGYLTLVFAGWAILLRSLVADTLRSGPQFAGFFASMFLFSMGLAVGGWFIDKTYTQRKVRVIAALNHLTQAAGTFAADLKKIPLDLLEVSGYDTRIQFDLNGYKEALVGAICVYFVPLVAVIMAGIVMLVAK
jgi:hypothetical protein